MNSSKLKIVKVLSNGSVVFSSDLLINKSQIQVFEQDIISFYGNYNQKNVFSKKTNFSLQHKKKYLK
jgi:hypothetical protein